MRSLSLRSDQIVAIVLGTRTTKAVCLQNDNQTLVLRRYLLAEAPSSKTGLSRGLLTTHLREIRAKLETETDRLVLVLGMGDALFRQVELPWVDEVEMRRIVRINSKYYFQQDLPDYEFDFRPLSRAPHGVSVPPGEGPHKRQVVVGGARRQHIEDLQAAAAAAGWHLVQIALSQVSLVNAARLAMPEILSAEAVALIDVGFITSTISLLVKGELALTRIVGSGGDRLTGELAEAMGINYQVAEGIKLVMPGKIQGKLQELISPLGAELRAAIDFLESQQDIKVARVLISGGSARSELVVQLLQEKLGIPCQRWNYTAFLRLALSTDQAKEVDNDGPQLAAALGAGAGWFKPGPVQIDLLAEQKQIKEQWRRNPVRRAAWAASFLLFFLLLWMGNLALQLWMKRTELRRAQNEVTALQNQSKAIVANAKKAAEIESTLQALRQHAIQRFPWAGPLSALQFAMVNDIQVLNLRLEARWTELPAPKTTSAAAPPGNGIPGYPAKIAETLTMILQAKDTGNPPATDRFIEAIAGHPFFKDHLRRENPIILKERLAPQADLTNPARSFVIFTIQCNFNERTF